MTLAEFNAWLDGFSEAIDEAPTPKQWKKIRDRLTTVKSTVEKVHVYHDRYREYYPWRIWYGSGATTTGGRTLSANVDDHRVFTSGAEAWRMAGKLEAEGFDGITVSD